MKIAKRITGLILVLMMIMLGVSVAYAEDANAQDAQAYPIPVESGRWNIEPDYYNSVYQFKETLKDSEVLYCELFFVDAFDYANFDDYDPVSEDDDDDHYTIGIFNDKRQFVDAVYARNGRNIVLAYDRNELGSDGIIIQIKNNSSFAGLALVNCKKLKGYCNNVSVKPDTLELKMGEGAQLSYNCEQADDSTGAIFDSWTSSDKEVATVDQDGFVTANSTGTCNVTATMKGGAKASCSVKVINPDPYLNYDELDLGTGQSKTLKLIYAADNVTWKSSNKKVATVSKSGKVKALKSGKCTITAKSAGNTYECAVHVTKPKVYFYAALETYNTRSNYFVVRIRNNSYKKLYITGGTKARHNQYKAFDRKVYLKKKVTIPPNKTKNVKFYVKGGLTSDDLKRFGLSYTFKFDGKKYNGKAYWSASDYKAGKKWKSTYPDDEYEEYDEWWYSY